jgi:hypothetical protein
VPRQSHPLFKNTLFQSFISSVLWGDTGTRPGIMHCQSLCYFFTLIDVAKEALLQMPGSWQLHCEQRYQSLSRQ